MKTVLIGTVALAVGLVVGTVWAAVAEWMDAVDSDAVAR